MTGRGYVADRVSSWPPWTRTGLTVVGAGLVFVAVYVTNDILTTLSEMDGHAAAHSAAGAMVAIVLIALPAFLLGVMVAALGLTVPGATGGPSIPDLGFTARQRRRVVHGALLQGFGPIVGAVLGIFLGQFAFTSSPLVTFPFVVGWGLMLSGFGSCTLNSRVVPEFVTNPLEGVSQRAAIDSNSLALVRTAVVIVGLLGFAFGVAHIFGPLPEAVGSVEAGLLTAWGSAAVGFGTLVPGRGRGYRVPPVGFSPRQARLVGWGATAVAVAPLLGVVTWYGGFSYLASSSLHLVYLGWVSMAIGLALRGHSRFSSRSG